MTEERRSWRTLHLPGETLTSRASRGGHSLPGPPRDARDLPRTAGANNRPGGRTTGSRIAFVRDPDGYRIELVERGDLTE